MNNLKLHLHKYIFYDFFAMFLFILITFISIKLYNAYQLNKKTEYDFSNYDNFMNDVYNINPNLFEFDSNGIAYVEMNDLLKPITNGKDTLSFGIIPLTKEQDQCVGYIIVKKEIGILKFDYSHLCDMIDY